MIEKLAKSLFGFCHNQLTFKKPPRLFLKTDAQNAKIPFGKTAFYDPSHAAVTVYIAGRHTKDILRSLAHELIHHHQNERGDLQKCMGSNLGPGYAQKNKDLRDMEKEAYLKGNMLFRDWEDSCKAKINMEEHKMNINLKELKNLIQESILESLSNKINTNEDGVVKEEDVSVEGDTPLEEETEADINEMGMSYKRDDEEVEEAPEIADEEASMDLSQMTDEDLDILMQQLMDEKSTRSAQCGEAPEEAPEEAMEIDNLAPDDTMEETNVMTPEREQTLKEYYMGSKRARLFEQLTKKWTK